jgi:hypothetical protein
LDVYRYLVVVAKTGVKYVWNICLKYLFNLLLYTNFLETFEHIINKDFVETFGAVRLADTMHRVYYTPG